MNSNPFNITLTLHDGPLPPTRPHRAGTFFETVIPYEIRRQLTRNPGSWHEISPTFPDTTARRLTDSARRNGYRASRRPTGELYKNTKEREIRVFIQYDPKFTPATKRKNAAKGANV